jgi:NADH-quinone oxidoreductase subunit G
LEAPVLGARLRKAWINGADVGVIGAPIELTFEYAHLGDGPQAISGLLARDHTGVKDKPSLVIVGQAALRRADGEAVLAAAQRLAEATGSGLLILHTAAARVGAMDAGVTCEGGMEAALDGADVVYNLGMDEAEVPGGPFVIYQGSHGDRGAHRADVILPAAAYTEEAGLFVNLEGRPQLAFRASFPPGEAKENWAILRALSAEIGAVQGWDSLAQIRQALVKAAPVFKKIDAVAQNEGALLPEAPMSDVPFALVAQDFYLSNPIARASQLMAELSRSAAARAAQPLAAE